MQLLGRAQPFDRGDVITFVLHGQRQARIDAPPIDEHRACAALPVVTALLGAAEAQVLPQRIEQRRARIQRRLGWLAVDDEAHLHGAACTVYGFASRPRLARTLSGELEAILIGSLLRGDPLDGVLPLPADPDGEDAAESVDARRDDDEDDDDEDDDDEDDEDDDEDDEDEDDEDDDDEE